MMISEVGLCEGHRRPDGRSAVHHEVWTTSGRRGGEESFKSMAVLFTKITDTFCRSGHSKGKVRSLSLPMTLTPTRWH